MVKLKIKTPSFDVKTRKIVEPATESNDPTPWQLHVESQLFLLHAKQT